MTRQSSIWNAEDDLFSLLTTSVTVSPTQQKVAEQLMRKAAAGEVCLLQGPPGMGKSTVLRWVHARLGSATGPQLLFADNAHLVAPAASMQRALKGRGRMIVFRLTKLKAEDYLHISRCYLGDAANRLDMAKIQRAAPALNRYQIKHASLRLALRYDAPTTTAFLHCL